MVSNDWIAREQVQEAFSLDAALAMLVYEAGAETGLVLAAVPALGINFTLSIEKSIRGVRLVLELAQRLPHDLESALVAAVHRCTKGPLELKMTWAKDRDGDPSGHTWSVQNGIEALPMPKH